MKQEIKRHLRRKLNSLQRRRPHIKKVDFTYEKNSQGGYITKLKAKTDKKTIHLKDEDGCLQSSISRIFNSLNRVLDRKKHRENLKLEFDLQDSVYS